MGMLHAVSRLLDAVLCVKVRLFENIFMLKKIFFA